MSFTTDLKRIIRSGFINFSRNSLVSVASVLIMSVTLSIIGLLIFLNALFQFSLTQIQNKVDVTVYFYPTTSETAILDLQQLLNSLPEVLETEYITRDQALESFRNRNADDYLTLQALEELGDNPLRASLNIRARDASRYQTIVDFLESDQLRARGLRNSIETINFYNNQEIIERLNNVISVVKRLGFALTLFFVAISMIIVFITIRLAIYVSREEISVMRLVGAENKYIQGPFMVEGILYGGIAAVLSLCIMYPLTLWATNKTQDFFGGLSLVRYYGDNFFQILIILLVAGAVLGALSSGIAIRKYLSK